MATAISISEARDKMKSESHRMAISLSLKRYYAEGGKPWNAGKSGYEVTRIQGGRTWTEEQKKEQSEKFKGRKNTWMIAWNKEHKTGVSPSIGQRNKLSKSLKKARA